MTIALYMAISADGRTARPNGSEEFLDEANWERFVELAEEYGAFLVGRTTYEVVASWDDKDYDNVDATCLVLSNDSNAVEADWVTVVTSPSEAAELADDLLVTGGASANTAFFENELVETVHLNVEPVLVGDGVGVVTGEQEVSLRFVRMGRTGSRLQLEYRVSYESSSASQTGQ